VTDDRLPATPFKGLAAFEATEADAMLFFGREREREIIAANLLASRVTVLYGASGVGKSSVLRAGVAYRLRELEAKNLADGRRRELAVVLFSSWSGAPVRELRAAVGAELFGHEGEDETGPESLTDALEQWTNELDVDLYLILDQVDEYFLYRGLEAVEGALDDELPELVTRPRLRVNTVLSLREDALASLDFFKARVPNMLGNRLRLEHLDRTAARAAIVGPLDAYNRLAPGDRRVEIEPKLVDAVLDQVAVGVPDYRVLGRGRAAESSGSEQIEAPYLQLVMQRLWDDEQSRGDPGLLSVEALGQLGGAQRIVEDHLQNALAALTSNEKDGAARMFDHLVTPSGTKIAHRISDLHAYAALPEPNLEQVLDRLTSERILRRLSDGPNDEGGRYEIFHDVLAEAVVDWRNRHVAERELEQARGEAERRTRRALLVAGTALFALVVMVAVTVFALTQRTRARTEAQRARARELAALALSQLSSDPQRSLKLAVDAARFERSREVGDALRQALLQSRLRLVLPSTAPLSTALFDPAGKAILTAGRDGKARIYDGGTGRLLHRLPGSSPLTTASFNRNGRLVITGAENGAARIWETRSGKLLHELSHPGPVRGASFGPDGNLVVTADGAGFARIWDVASGQLLRVLTHGKPVLGASFSRDGELILTFTSSAASLFATHTGLLVHELRQSGGLTSASFGPAGRSVVTTTSRGLNALLWDVRTGNILHVLGPHKRGVATASFSPSGTLIVTASADGAGRVWAASTGEKVAVLPGHTNPLTDASFSPDSQWVVTASRDRTARVFDATSGRVITELVGHLESVASASYASTGNRVVTASDDGTARVWDPYTEPELRKLGTHSRSKAVVSVVFSHNGKFAVSAGNDRTARVWRVNAHDQRPVRTLTHLGGVTSASFSPDDSLVLTTSRDRTARIWRGQKRIVLRHGRQVFAGSFSPGGHRVVTASADKTARIWDVRTGEQLRVLHHNRPVRAVSFSPDGKLVATGSDDRNARLWDVRRGKLLYLLRGHSGAVRYVSFSPDGKLLVTAGTDRAARVWDTKTGAVVQVLRGHEKALTSASFSPDGRLVVTSSIDKDPRIWSVATGKTIHVLRGHFTSVNEARFSPDGRWVVTAGPRAAGLWPTDSGRLFLYLFGHHDALTSASFSPDGRRIVTSGDDGTVRLYTCEVCPTIDGLVTLAQHRLAQAARNLNPAQRHRYKIG
jgi:WD40 repeat protein